MEGKTRLVVIVITVLSELDRFLFERSVCCCVQYCLLTLISDNGIVSGDPIIIHYRHYSSKLTHTHMSYPRGRRCWAGHWHVADNNKKMSCISRGLHYAFSSARLLPEEEKRWTILEIIYGTLSLFTLFYNSLSLSSISESEERNLGNPSKIQKKVIPLPRLNN